jgi:alpha-1,2-mannosyltransferase
MFAATTDAALALTSQRRRVARLALLAAAGIAAVEVVHTVRILMAPVEQRRFPHGYVSKGIWAAYAYIRPLDRTSSDISPPLAAAERALRRDPQLYTEFNQTGLCFIYPPTAAIELLPFGWVAGRAGMPRAVQLMDLLGRICALVTVLIALWFMRWALRGPRDWLVALVILLAFFPIRWALFCVNAQTLISLFLAGAILAYVYSRGTLCGVLLGLATCLKPYLAPLVLFALARREWKVAAAAVVTGSALILTGLLLLGFAPWEAYLRDVLPAASAGYAKWGNQSFLGLARRWAGDAQVWQLVPTSPGVTYFGWCAAAVSLVLAVLPRGYGLATATKKAPDGSTSSAEARSVPPALLFRGGDIGIAVLLATMASPIAWDHYYGWAVVLFCICLAAGRSLQAPLVFYVLLGVSYVLLATDWRPVAAGCPGPVSLLDSPKLLAAVLLLGITWHACRRLHLRRSTGVFSAART